MLPYVQIIIPTYSLMVVIGFIVCFAFLKMRNEKFHFDKKDLIGFTIFSVIGMLVGSKFVFMVSRIPYVIENHLPISQLVQEFLFGGYVFYGGILGAIGFLALYCKLRKLDKTTVFNYIIPGFIVFHAFGRIGCFLGGCCYGIEVSWGIPYNGVNRFPVQLVECFVELGIALYLLHYEDCLRKKETMGEYHLLRRYLLLYPVARFLLEFLRGDTERGFFGILSTSQWISIFVVLIVVFTTCLKLKRKR